MGCCMTSNEGNNGQANQGNVPGPQFNGANPPPRQGANRPRGSRPSQASAVGGVGGSQTGLRIQYLQNHNVERIL